MLVFIMLALINLLIIYSSMIHAKKVDNKMEKLRSDITHK